MTELDRSDKQHLEAAQGWLGLGNWQEANEELEQITPELRAHPEVLEVRWGIYAAAGKWEAALEIASALIRMLPDDPRGWIHRSYCLHELKRTAEARDNLLRVVNQFPESATVGYNLACYECQLNQTTRDRYTAQAQVGCLAEAAGRAGTLEAGSASPPYLSGRVCQCGVLRFRPVGAG